MSAYHKIVCATDFSQSADHAAMRAASLAQCYKASLTLLHVVDHFPEDSSNEVIAPEDKDPAEFRREKALADLNKVAAAVDSLGARLEVRFSTHSARHVILEYAAEAEADLIVIGKHGSHGVLGMLGSTSHGLVNLAECDVLVVPGGD